MACPQPRRLPPGWNANDFEYFVKSIVPIVGAENLDIISADKELADGDYVKTRASPMICTPSVPEVQDVMRLCNNLQMPVWPFSIGRNTGYGGAAPRVPGSLGIELGKHLKKVLEVNVDGAYALVEPGVTFAGLYEHLVKTGLSEQLWLDVPDLGGGSIIRNTLERGVGYTPYGDHFMMHCGMELFNYGFGPYNDGIFSQSSLGIVVKMGVWKTVIQNVPTIRHLLLDAAVAGSKASYTNKTDSLSDEDLDALASRLDLGRWNFYGAVYVKYLTVGPEPVRKFFLDTIKAAFLKVPGSKFFFAEDRNEPHSVLKTREKTLRGIPFLDELRWVSRLTTLVTAGYQMVRTCSFRPSRRFQEKMPSSSMKSQSAGSQKLGSTSLAPSPLTTLCLTAKTDPQQRLKARWLIRQLIQDCAERGWGEYRTYLALMDQIANTYNFNNNAQMKLNEPIKNALDPNGILAPGKNGIWPQKYNKKEWMLREDEADRLSKGYNIRWLHLAGVLEKLATPGLRPASPWASREVTQAHQARCGIFETG
ncbi:vanillyl-alcohol oxidase [Colletotrichum salicis]|uniref:Vanillyl-alcohol oxidase n=1 Tax=Colletotrichum salicis TaxID=1209931 RepID=A0A135V8Z1_9PEZI|nr:vanillyl-alcohol oxidase [Colletotrichum salicis]